MNSDFGKPGRDNFFKEMAKHNIKVVADISTELGQTDFSADVIKVKAAKPTRSSSTSTKKNARAS